MTHCFVGIPGSIIFSVYANGTAIQGMVFPFELQFTGGNWMGPIDDVATPGPPDNVVPSALASATFASIAWNSFYGSGHDPDTMLYGFTSFGGPWTANAEVFRINITPSGAGTVFFKEAGVFDVLDLLDPTGASIPFQWHPDTIVSVFNPAPTSVATDIIANCPGSTFEGGSVAIHIGSDDVRR